MTLSTEARQKIAAALLQNRKNFDGSDAQYSLSFDINKSVFNRIKNGETEQLMNDKKWISTARRLGVQLGDEPEWLPAHTAVFEYLISQMTICKAESLSGMYCDVTEVGKTFAGKYMAANTKNTIYIDCSQYKSKQKLVRAIAQGFGLEHSGKYAEVFSDLAYYLRVVYKPLIILDEAGDLEYSAFLELKALWNAAEYLCGWYMMGADGLEQKINRGRDNKKVGFAENFSRFGSKYNRLTPRQEEERLEFWKEEACKIIEANAPAGTDIQTLINRSIIGQPNGKKKETTNGLVFGSNRSLRTQILKLKRLKATYNK